MLANKTILVTGASGFIGSRLVEKLILEEKATVRAYVRSLHKAVRIARFPVEIISGEITDQHAVERAVAGCDAVIHCAHDFGTVKGNVAAIDFIGDACLRHNVRRLVYASSIAVYQPFANGDITEESSQPPNDWHYVRAKRAVERRLMELVDEHQLPAIILRLGVVYGPFSPNWTDQPVASMINGQFFYPSEGTGLLNAVYIDDVVDALILAAGNPSITARSFLISGPEPVAWKTFFEAYARHLRRTPFQCLGEAEIQRLRNTRRNAVLKNALRNPVLFLHWLRRFPAIEALMKGAFEYLPQRAKARVRKRLGPGGDSGEGAIYLPDDRQLAQFRSLAHVRIDKSRELLGYHPKFDFVRGMAMTLKYVDWAFPSARD